MSQQSTARSSPPRSPLPPRHPRQPAAMTPLQLPAAQLDEEQLPRTPGGPQTSRVAAPRSDSPSAAAAAASASAARTPRKLTNPTPILVGRYRAIAAHAEVDGDELQWEPFVATIEKVDYSDVLLLLSGSSSVEVPRAGRAERQLQPELARVPFRITGAIDTSNLSASMARAQTQGARDEEKFTGSIEHPEGGAEREWHLKLRCGSVACSITLQWIPDSPALAASSPGANSLLAVEPASTNSPQPHSWHLLSDPSEGADEPVSSPQPQSRTRSNSGPSSRKYQVSSVTSGNVSRASSPAYSSPARSSSSSSSSSSRSSASSSASSSGRASPAAGRATPPRLLGNPLFEPSSKLSSQVKKTAKKTSQVVPWM